MGLRLDLWLLFWRPAEAKVAVLPLSFLSDFTRCKPELVLLLLLAAARAFSLPWVDSDIRVCLMCLMWAPGFSAWCVVVLMKVEKAKVNPSSNL